MSALKPVHLASTLKYGMMAIIFEICGSFEQKSHIATVHEQEYSDCILL
jgi:hypothetical protein